jgi:hypothetical protein
MSETGWLAKPYLQLELQTIHIRPFREEGDNRSKYGPQVHPREGLKLDSQLLAQKLNARLHLVGWLRASCL